MYTNINGEKKYEILSPAGSVEQLVSSVNNGCDSVYLGLELFNARMKAPNFTKENLAHWVDYCHLFGVKVYVAINTSIKNDEFDNAVKLLLTAYKSNVDGVILTDLALIKIASTFPKPFEIVASTQLNCHDEYGAKFLKEIGATTVVCSRECSYNDIEKIAKCGVNVECFIHGALCVSQSGQCLFSSIVGGNSGNRGLCAQPCRKLYQIKSTKKKGYFLSARDINGTNSAFNLLKAGARTFKIEGRNRSPEYAGQASTYYQKLFKKCATKEDEQKLNETFNRGNTNNISYLTGGNDNIIYEFINSNIGVRAGTSCIENKNVRLVAEKEILKGDSFKILDGNEFVCAATALSSGEKGTLVNLQLFDCNNSKKICNGLIVNRTSSVAIKNETLSSRKKLQIKIKFCGKIGERAKISAQYGNIEKTFISDFIIEQKNKIESVDDVDKTKQEICEQLRKTGDSCFTITDIDIEIDNIFIAKSQINELRRKILQELEKQIINNYDKRFDARKDFEFNLSAGYCVSNISDNNKLNNFSCKLKNILLENDTNSLDIFTTEHKQTEPCLAVVVYTQKFFDLIVDKKNKGIKYIIYKTSSIDKETLEIASDKSYFYLDLPSFCDLDYLKSILPQNRIGLVCNNIGQVQFARQNGLKYICGRGLNIFNDYMLLPLKSCETFVYSYELTLREIDNFIAKNGLIFVDGNIPLMQLQHCPFKVAFACKCDNCMSNSKRLSYTDELGNEFVVYKRRDKMCRFELLNGRKLSAVNKLNNRGRYLIDAENIFSANGYSNLNAIEHYLNINSGTSDNYVENLPYTKGRLYDKIN